MSPRDGPVLVWGATLGHSGPLHPHSQRSEGGLQVPSHTTAVTRM